MKIIIAGGRDFKDAQLLSREVYRVVNSIPDISIEDIEIVLGTTRGADKLGEYWAIKNNIKIKRFHPDWDKHGKSAGPIRNKEMAEYGDCLVAFWDGKSRGTKNMIELAEKNGLKVHVVNYHPH